MDQLDFGVSKTSVQESTLWTKEKILSQVGQEEIFEEYLGIPVSYRGLFRSPIREDDTPTCSFKWINNKLLFRDWSETKSKDCFDIVKDLYNCDFYTSLEIIAKKFCLTKKDPRKGFVPHEDSSLESPHRQKNNEKSIIEVKRQPFTYQDIEYLNKYHLTKKIVNYYNVYSVKAFWLNGSLYYTHSLNKPALGYYFGTDNRGRQKWKLYFYNTRDSFRFLGNTNRINGWVQIPETGKLLIITKSLKDVMCLAKFKIPAIAMQGEAQMPYENIIQKLRERFDHIYTFMDYDRTGIKSAAKIRRLYDIPALFLDNQYEEKDFSDYIASQGLQKTKELVSYGLKYIGLNPSDFV